MEASVLTQNDQILAHLRAGNQITPIEALERFGCFRLAARIGELRERGYAIEVRKLPIGDGKRVAQYRMVERR